MNLAAWLGLIVHSSSKNTERRLCDSIDWKPDVNVLSNNQVLAYCVVGRPLLEHFKSPGLNGKPSQETYTTRMISMNVLNPRTARDSFTLKSPKNLQGTFHGELDPLDLLFHGDLVKTSYRDAGGPWNCMKLHMEYLKVLAHRNPGMHILEAGAGTRGATTPILGVYSVHEY